MNNTTDLNRSPNGMLLVARQAVDERLADLMNGLFHIMVNRYGKAITGVSFWDEGDPTTPRHLYAHFFAPCDKAIVTELREGGFTNVFLYDLRGASIHDITPP